jgi:hypothetical protein
MTSPPPILYRASLARIYKYSEFKQILTSLRFKGGYLDSENEIIFEIISSESLGLELTQRVCRFIMSVDLIKMIKHLTEEGVSIPSEVQLLYAKLIRVR